MTQQTGSGAVVPPGPGTARGIATDASAAAARIQRMLPFALAAVWVLWGSTYLAMRFAVTSLPPFLMGGTRFVLAGSVLLAIVKMRGETMPSRRAWLVAIPVGALLFLVGNGGVVLAEQRIPSSIAAVVCATTPLILTGLSSLRGDRPTRMELFGMILGLVGVAVLGVGSPLSGAGVRGLLILGAPVGWAAGSLVARIESSKEHGGARGLGAAGANMVAGGVWMLVVGTVLGERFAPPYTTTSLVAWVYLVTFGSLIGFTAYSWLLAHARPAVAMSYAYVNPVVAVLLGAALGGEALGWATIAATLLIAGGVMASVVLGRRARA